MRLNRKNILFFYVLTFVVVALLVYFVDAIDTVRGILIYGVVVIATFGIKKIRSSSRD